MPLSRSKFMKTFHEVFSPYFLPKGFYPVSGARSYARVTNRQLVQIISIRIHGVYIEPTINIQPLCRRLFQMHEFRDPSTNLYAPFFSKYGGQPAPQASYGIIEDMEVYKKFEEDEREGRLTVPRDWGTFEEIMPKCLENAIMAAEPFFAKITTYEELFADKEVLGRFCFGDYDSYLFAYYGTEQEVREYFDKYIATLKDNLSKCTDDFVFWKNFTENLERIEHMALSRDYTQLKKEMDELTEKNIEFLRTKKVLVE